MEVMWRRSMRRWWSCSAVSWTGGGGGCWAEDKLERTQTAASGSRAGNRLVRRKVGKEASAVRGNERFGDARLPLRAGKDGRGSCRNEPCFFVADFDEN